MSKKIKAFLSIILMSLAFFMMIDTRYARPLGDYVVEFFGLNSWTGDQTGWHLSVFYFTILFILFIRLVQKYAIDALNIQPRTVLVFFLGLNFLFVLVTGMVTRTIKANYQGMLAIGIEEKNDLVYEFNGERYTQYDLDITLKNYGEEDQSFHLIVKEDDGIGSAKLYNLTGADDLFHLAGNEKKRFVLTAANVSIDEINLPDYDWANGVGSVDRLILLDGQGEKVQLAYRDFLGLTVYD